MLGLGFAQDGSPADRILGADSPSELNPRRYNDLLAIVTHYESDFDERKYWAYGCNCLILGDRPMSEMGKGKPVDELDTACKDYKSCQKCVRMEFGPDCIGEKERYSWKKTKGDGFGPAGRSGEVECTDEPGTCRRSLCECDLDYAKKIPGTIGQFNPDYHLFYTTIGWDPDTSCQRNKGESKPECCSTTNGPMKIFNSLQKECCQDGSIKRIGFCPPAY